MSARNPFAPVRYTSVGFTTSGDFLRHLSEDDAAFSGETARVNALPDTAIPAADLLQFSNLLAAYTTFSTQARKTANEATIPLMSKSDDQLIAFETQLRQWQDHTAALGFPAIAPMVPRDASNELPGVKFGLDGSTKLLIGGGIALALILVLRR